MKKCDIFFYQDNMRFIHQAYLKDDFANVLLLNKKEQVVHSFRLCFKTMEVKGTWGKETQRWKQIKNKISVYHLKKQLDFIHNT